MIDVGLESPAVVRTAPAVRTEGRRPVVGVPRPSVSSIAVFVLVMAITAALAVAAYVVNDRNEQRLLTLQTKQTGILLQVALQGTQTPLASAAEIAANTGGDSASFRKFVAPLVGAKSQFVSVSLWQAHGSTATLVSTVGAAPRLASSPSRASSFLSDPARRTQLGVIGLMSGSSPRLGYAYASTDKGVRDVVYAESALPSRRRPTTIDKSSPFADLRFALYFGKTHANSALLLTTEEHLPLHGRTAQTTIPFGSSSLTLVAGSVGELGGKFAAWRWWIIGVIGLVVAVAAAFTTDRLVKRRRGAEALTHEIDELLQDQRTIAESLQRAMLPSDIPQMTGLEIATRYLPGVHGIEIGGDWYDVIAVDDKHFYFVVGDVSGRGLEAGAVMASLHFAIRAFISEGHDPATVLNLLTRVLILGRDKHFATILCGFADIDLREITIANAGHLPPLIVDGESSGFVATEVGPPIGVSSETRYRPITIRMGERSTLLAYTDGLVERRGEALDEGLQRLQASACATKSSVDEMLSTVLAELTPDGADDDTAVLALRWTGEA